MKKGLEILNQGDVKHMLGWPGRMIGEDAGGCIEKWVEDDLMRRQYLKKQRKKMVKYFGMSLWMRSLGVGGGIVKYEDEF